MPVFDNIANLSPLPIVDLREIGVPASGLVVGVSNTCVRNFSKDDTCRRHYESLFKSPELEGKPTQCPYGFATCAVRTKSQHVAFVGIIPYPRLGGSKERDLAKNSHHAKLPVAAFKQAADTILEAEKRIAAMEQNQIESQSMALHEIRKLNARVKQTAERLCKEQSPS